MRSPQLLIGGQSSSGITTRVGTSIRSRRSMAPRGRRTRSSSISQTWMFSSASPVSAWHSRPPGPAGSRSPARAGGPGPDRRGPTPLPAPPTSEAVRPPRHRSRRPWPRPGRGRRRRWEMPRPRRWPCGAHRRPHQGGPVEPQGGQRSEEIVDRGPWAVGRLGTTPSPGVDPDRSIPPGKRGHLRLPHPGVHQRGVQKDDGPTPSFLLVPEAPVADVDERHYPPPRPVIWRSADRSG
jgi:hypothetical protein